MIKSANHSYCLKKQFDFASIKNEFEEALKCNLKVKSPTRSKSAQALGTKYNFFQILFKYMPKEVATDLFESFRKETNEGQIVKELLAFKDEISAEYKNKLIEILTFFVFSNKFMAMVKRRNTNTSVTSLSPVSKTGRNKKEMVVDSTRLLITKSSFFILKENKLKSSRNNNNISPVINEQLKIIIPNSTKQMEIKPTLNKNTSKKEGLETVPLLPSKTPDNRKKSPVFIIEKGERSPVNIPEKVEKTPETRKSLRNKTSNEEFKKKTAEMKKRELSTNPTSSKINNSNNILIPTGRKENQVVELSPDQNRSPQVQRRPQMVNSNIHPYVNMMMSGYYNNPPNNKMMGMMNMNVPFYPPNLMFNQGHNLSNVAGRNISFSSPYIMEEKSPDNSLLKNCNPHFQRNSSKSSEKPLLGNKTKRDESFTSTDDNFSRVSASKTEIKKSLEEDIQIKVQSSGNKEEEKYPHINSGKASSTLNATSAFNQSFQIEKNQIDLTEENFHKNIINIFSQNFDEAALDKLTKMLNLTEEKINKIRKYIIEKNYPKGKKEYILLFSQEHLKKGLYLKVDSAKKKYSLVKKKLDN